MILCCSCYLLFFPLTFFFTSHFSLCISSSLFLSLLPIFSFHLPFSLFFSVSLSLFIYICFVFYSIKKCIQVSIHTWLVEMCILSILKCNTHLWLWVINNMDGDVHVGVSITFDPCVFLISASFLALSSSLTSDKNFLLDFVFIPLFNPFFILIC